MCVVCGCNQPGKSSVHEHADSAGAPSATGDLHYGQGPAKASVTGLSPARMVKLEADVLGANQRLADHNRLHFTAHGIKAYNLMSSPGSGKTTLLCATIAALRELTPDLPVAVIEGDQQTTLDADRIRAAGVAAIQVNTGRGCHLDAQMVGDAFARLDLHAHAHHDHGHDHVHEHGHSHGEPHHHTHDHAHNEPAALLLIENVGNLVCPALWDLGETAKVVILSVTEGADKPLKYPDMFAAAKLMVINKMDLLAHVDFDVQRCIENARRINPEIEVLQVSATRGDGMQGWLDWLLRAQPIPIQAPADSHTSPETAALHARIAALEAQLAQLQHPA